MRQRDVGWADVPGPWRRCLELAWESYREGSIPVGSVVTGPSGEVVAEGRNRAFGPPGAGLAGSAVAHAEMEALSHLPPGDYPGHTLWSTLEPCFMCSAAAVHSHIGNVGFAAADPLISGVDRLPSLNPWVQSRWPHRRGPLPGPIGGFAGLLPLVWLAERRPDGVVAATHREADSTMVELATRLARTAFDGAGTAAEAFDLSAGLLPPAERRAAGD
jgi:tRNA(Arg) A34 adenosine deaminase TadA